MRQLPFQHGPEGSQSILAKHSVLVDTDIGDDIDDALAIALILRSPEIDLRGITTVFGDTQRRARLAQHLLHAYDREDVPIAAGVRTPLQPRHRPSGVPQAAIIDSRSVMPATSALSGQELIIETALAHHGDLTILCLGPLTNVATALRIQPDLFMAIREIIMVGGTSGLPFPEWNVRSDARAAQIVLGAGIPVKLLGWNITTRCHLRGCDLQKLHTDNSPETQFLSQLLGVWKRHHHRWQPDLPFIHDALTVAALCAPELLEFEEMTARVLAHGPLTGFMVPRIMNGPLVQAATGIQVEATREWVMTRLITSSRMQTS
ncbi:MAG: nucleoside hydrolase [Ktedonobacteraceae bacterium]